MFTFFYRYRALTLVAVGLMFLAVVAAAAPLADPEALAPPRVTPGPLPVSEDVIELSLRDVLNMALTNTPSLQKQLSVIRQRDYEVEEAYAAAYPTAGFQTQYQRVEPPVSFNNTVISPADNYSFALTLQQPIYSFGRLRFSTLAAKLSRRSAQETYLAQLQEVIEGGARLYIQALVAEQAVDIAVDELEAQRANLRVTELLFEQGVVARFDSLRTGAATSRAEQDLIEAQTTREVARARLKSFMDLNLNQPILLVPLALEAPPAVTLRESQEEILERRSELRALRWAVEAAEARVSLARAQNSPSLALQNQTINRNATGFTPGTQNTTSLVLSIPLFDGGESKARANQAQEVVNQLIAELEQREREVVLEAQQTHRELLDRWRSIEVARENVEQANEALRVAILRYENGVSTTVELLDTQAERSRARFALAQAEAGYQQSYWQWRRVSVGEYPVEVPLPPRIRERMELERDLRVWDTEPPSLSISVSPDSIWPPNHRMVELSFDLDVEDNQDSDPLVEVVGVAVSEPDDIQGDDIQGSGNTAPDYEITADGKIFVRAERSGTGKKRIYTITYKATDNAGNTTFASADVIVSQNDGQ